jgi:hypothetical protein
MKNDHNFSQIKLMKGAITVGIKKVAMMKNGQFKQTCPDIRPRCCEAHADLFVDQWNP